MADIRIDGDDLNGAIQQTSAVVTYFENADTRAERAAQNVGHGGLSSKVNDFADAWDIRRGKFTESLTFVRDSLTAIRDTFDDIDQQIARDLTASTSSLSEAGNP